MIKVVIIDYGEVIATGIEGVEHLMAKECGIDPGEFMKKRLEVNAAFLDLMRGNMTEREYVVDHLLNGTGWAITPERMMELFRKNLNRPNLDVIRMLPQIRAKYPLMLFSDNLHEWVKYIREDSCLFSYFDHCFLSNEMGMVKADAGAFKYVVDHLDLHPAEILFIDDRQDNIDSAQDAGLNTILYENPEQLKNWLHDFGVIID